MFSLREFGGRVVPVPIPLQLAPTRVAAGLWRPTGVRRPELRPTPPDARALRFPFANQQRHTAALGVVSLVAQHVVSATTNAATQFFRSSNWIENS